MAKYRVLEKSFVNDAIREVGDIVDFNGIPAGNLEPMDPQGAAAAELLPQANAEADVRRKRAALGDTLEDTPVKTGTDTDLV
jgi:hypothetical protein